MTTSLAILCESRSHERVHYAFVIAAGAASIGRSVLLFATNGGLHGLCQDWSGLVGAERDARAIDRGIAGLSELREASCALGVRLIACEAGMRIEGIEEAALVAGVEIGGIASFISEAGPSIISL